MHASGAAQLLAATAFLGLSTASAWSGAAPRSVVSINLCADELVLRLAADDQVKSVTWLSHQSLSSAVSELAHDIPSNHGLAEEIVPLSPDLVISGIYTTRQAVGFLRRLGISVMDLDVPSSLEDVRSQIRDVAAALGREAAGQSMIEELDQALEPPSQTISSDRPTALVLRPNGFTAGPGSLVDDMLTQAGLINLAARMQTDRLGQIPLEGVILANPDVLILNSDPDTPASMAQTLLEHPALDRLRDTAIVVDMPTRLWTCAGPQLADAMDILRSAAREAQALRNREDSP